VDAMRIGAKEKVNKLISKIKKVVGCGKPFTWSKIS